MEENHSCKSIMEAVNTLIPCSVIIKSDKESTWHPSTQPVWALLGGSQGEHGVRREPGPPDPVGLTGICPSLACLPRPRGGLSQQAGRRGELPSLHATPAPETWLRKSIARAPGGFKILWNGFHRLKKCFSLLNADKPAPMSNSLSMKSPLQAEEPFLKQQQKLSR